MKECLDENLKIKSNLWIYETYEIDFKKHLWNLFMKIMKEFLDKNLKIKSNLWIYETYERVLRGKCKNKN